MAQMKKPVVKLTKKVYGEAVDKAFKANAEARKKTPAKKTPAKMPAAVPSRPIGNGTKKKVLVMPNKISPSKMTPAQKARYLKNPERYDG
jgi:hypothetical protein